MASESERETHASGEAVQVQPEHIDLDVLDSALSFFIRALHVAVTRDWDARVADLAAIRGTGKVTALLLIHNHPGIRPSVIAQLVLKNRSEMGRILDGLEANGLITRRTSSTDSRAWALFLTDAGEQMVQAIRSRVEESRSFFGDLTQEEYDAVIGPLRALYWRIVTRPRAEGGAAA